MSSKINQEDEQEISEEDFVRKIHKLVRDKSYSQQDLSRLFTHFDVDGSGALNRSELLVNISEVFKMGDPEDIPRTSLMMMGDCDDIPRSSPQAPSTLSPMSSRHSL